MANAGLIPYPKYKSILNDGSGLPNAGGKVYTYEAGTSTPKGTQVSRTGAANANPVILDSNGEANIWWLSGSYKVIETDADDVTLRTIDELSAAGDLPGVWTESGSDVYYSAGSVFIGASSGSKKLTVVGDGSFSTTLDVGGLITASAGLTTAGGNVTLGAGDDVILSSTSEINLNSGAFFASNSGVGIGTASNDRLLHIQGTETAIIRLENPSSLSDDELIGGVEFEKQDVSGAGSGVVGGMRMHSGSITGGEVYMAFSVSGPSANDFEAGRFEATGILELGYGLDIGANADLLLSTTSDIDVGSGNFTVAGATGNTSVGGTLGVTGVTTFTAQPIMSSLTASLPVFTDGSKGLVSNAITGTGNVMMSASPTTTGTLTGAISTWSGLLTANAGISTGDETFTYDEGSFTATGTGFGTGPTGTAQYVRVGKMVTLTIPALNGTSNATTFTITGLPAAIQPTQAQIFPLAYCLDNTAFSNDEMLQVETDGSITGYHWTGTAYQASDWTNSGTKGTPDAVTLTYQLN